MNKYAELKNKLQKEFDAFPFGFAFSNEQFEKMKKELGVKDNSELISIGAGGFIRKTDEKALDELINGKEKRMKEAIASDPTGKGFIKDMFLYELANHEYCITYELDDTLYALDLTLEEIEKDPRLKLGLQLAKNEYLASPENY